MNMLIVEPENRRREGDRPNADRVHWQGERLETEYIEPETQEFEDITVQLTEFIITLLLGFFVFAALAVLDLVGLSAVYLLAVLFAYDFFFLLRNLRLYLKNITFSRNRHINNMFGSFCALVFYALQFYYWYSGAITFLITLIPLGVSCLFKLCFKNYSVHGCQSMTFIILFFLRWIKLFTLCTIAISYDFNLHWHWYYLLWGVWLILLILAMISAASLILLIVALRVRDLGSDEVNFYIWVYVGSTGSVALMVLFIIYSDSNLWVYSFLNAFFFGMYSFLTFCWKTLILQWLDKYCSPEDSLPILSDSSLAFHSSHSEIAHRPLQLGMALSRPPRMLVRLSSTYYRPANFRTRMRSISLEHDERRENPNKLFASSPPKASAFEEVIKCGICWDRVSDTVIMPCKHGGVCYQCALIMFETKRSCYICRSPISRIYLVEEKEPQVVSIIDPSQ